jgi:hypothetical protein
MGAKRVFAAMMSEVPGRIAAAILVSLANGGYESRLSGDR